MTTITIDCKDKNIHEIIAWCNSHFGPQGWNWRSQFPSYRYDFMLPDAASATYFKLRWA